MERDMRHVLQKAEHLRAGADHPVRPNRLVLSGERGGDNRGRVCGACTEKAEARDQRGFGARRDRRKKARNEKEDRSRLGLIRPDHEGN